MSFFKRHFFATPWHLIRFFIPITGLIPLAVYWVTLFPHVYPGPSAVLTASAADLCKADGLSSPLFAMAASGVASLDWWTLPLRLNAFSAVCGAIAVALFYLLVARLVFAFACEDPGGAMAALPPRIREMEDDARTPTDRTSFAANADGSISIPASVLAHNRRVSHAAVLGGLGGASILAFCAPFWLVATRLYPYTFDLMLVFLIANLLISYDQSERLFSLFASFFLLTACCVESPLLLLLLPIGSLFLLRSLVLNEQVSAAKILGILMIGISGAAVAVLILWSAAAHCASIAVPAPRPILRVFLATQTAEVSRWVPSYGWSHIFMQVLFPTAIALFVFAFAFRKRTPTLFLTQLVLTACLVPGLLNLHISPWGMARFTFKIPVFSYTIIAFFAGLMIAVWHLMRETVKEKMADDLDFYEYRDNPTVCRLGSLLCWPLLTVALAVPFRSYPEIAPGEGAFADAVADTIYRELGHRDWIVNCPFLRHHLMIRAFRDGRSLHFIRTDSDVYDAKQLASYVRDDPDFAPYRSRLLNAADLSSASFIREWLKHETNAYQRVVLFNSPEIWRENGFRALPTGFFLSGQPRATPIDTMRVLENHRAFLDAVRPSLFPVKPDAIQLFANYRLALRRQLAVVANEIGVLLAEDKHLDEAAELFAQSESLAPDNLSLLLNRYHLAVNANVHTTALAELEARLNAEPQHRNTFSLTLDDLQKECGTLINPDILEYARKNYWTKTNAYRNLAIFTRVVSSDPLIALRDKKRDLYQAITRSIDGNAFNDAERQLNLLLDLDEKDHFALVNKALVAIERKDLPEAGLWMDLAKENGVPPSDLIWHEAAILILNGKLAEARAMLNAAVPADPSNIRLWGLLADILIKIGEYSELENRVYPAVRSASSKRDHYLLYMIRGYIYKHNGPREYTAARAAFLRAFELNANLTEIQEEVLHIDDALDVPAFTEQDAKAVLRKDPEHAFANYLLGMAHLHRGDLDKAQDLFLRSLEKEKAKNAPAYAGLGAVLLARHDTASAEKLLRRAIEIDPSRPFTRHILAQVLLAEGRPEEALQQLEPVMHSCPDDLDVRLTFIRIRMRQKKYAEIAAMVSDLLEKEDQLPLSIASQLHPLAEQLRAELSK